MSFKATGPKTRPERVKPPPKPPSPDRSRRSSAASTSSFTSAVEAQKLEDETQEQQRFSPEEEAKMVEESHQIKAQANTQFLKKDYSSALSTYDKALAECPNYLDYELAVLQSNIAACHLQLQEWKEAIDAAQQGLDNLERELPMPKPKKDGQTKTNNENEQKTNGDPHAKVVELPEENDEEANTEILRRLDLSDQKKADIYRIRTKLLLRHARAKLMIIEDKTSSSAKPVSYIDTDNSKIDEEKRSDGKMTRGSTWGNLSGALEDYSILAQPEYFRILPSSDQKTVLEALRTLPPRIEAAKKKEVDEMMGKLKDLGNGILKPFGLSTDMFKMTQDPNTGGWSMNFDGKAGK